MGQNDGRHDFDFLFGAWQITNRKRVNMVVPGDDEWVEFEATSEARPIVGGLGNIDTYSAPEFPGRPGFEAFTLRLFEPNTALWRIWWASMVNPGVLDEPVVGRFEDDGVGGADPTRGTENQQGFAFLEPASVPKGMDHRCVGDQQGRAFDEAKLFGQGESMGGRHCHLFGEAAVAVISDQPVTDLPALDPFADRLDLASHLTARRERPRRPELVFVLDDQHVGIVDGAGADPDQQLAWARAGLRNLA